MNYSYIVKSGRVIARTDATEAGRAVAGYATVKSDIDANYERFLVNAERVQVSNGKKWESKCDESTPFAVPVGPRQPREFLIRS